MPYFGEHHEPDYIICVEPRFTGEQIATDFVAYLQRDLNEHEEVPDNVVSGKSKRFYLAVASLFRYLQKADVTFHFERDLVFQVNLCFQSETVTDNILKLIVTRSEEEVFHASPFPSIVACSAETVCEAMDGVMKKLHRMLRDMGHNIEIERVLSDPSYASAWLHSAQEHEEPFELAYSLFGSVSGGKTDHFHPGTTVHVILLDNLELKSAFYEVHDGLIVAPGPFAFLHEDIAYEVAKSDGGRVIPMRMSDLYHRAIDEETGNGVGVVPRIVTKDLRAPLISNGIVVSPSDKAEAYAVMHENGYYGTETIERLTSSRLDVPPGIVLVLTEEVAQEIVNRVGGIIMQFPFGELRAYARDNDLLLYVGYFTGRDGVNAYPDINQAKLGDLPLPALRDPIMNG